jgi:hypothetical protein
LDRGRLRIILKNSGFIISKEVLGTTEEMVETLNPILIFANEMLEIQPELSVGTVELFQVYAEWCAEGKNRPLGRNRFLKEMTQTFRQVRKCSNKGGKQAFEGVGLTASARAWYRDRLKRFKRYDELEE